MLWSASVYNVCVMFTAPQSVAASAAASRRADVFFTWLMVKMWSRRHLALVRARSPGLALVSSVFSLLTINIFTVHELLAFLSIHAPCALQLQPNFRTRFVLLHASHATGLDGVRWSNTRRAVHHVQVPQHLKVAHPLHWYCAQMMCYQLYALTVFLQHMVNLRIMVTTAVRCLTEVERTCACMHAVTVHKYRSARVIIMTDAQLRKTLGKYLHGHYQLGIFAASMLSLCSIAAYLQTTAGAHSDLYCMG
eukprot:8075-Heterococcus_DN1.PRE.4